MAVLYRNIKIATYIILKNESNYAKKKYLAEEIGNVLLKVCIEIRRTGCLFLGSFFYALTIFSNKYFTTLYLVSRFSLFVMSFFPNIRLKNYIFPSNLGKIIRRRYKINYILYIKLIIFYIYVKLRYVFLIKRFRK